MAHDDFLLAMTGGNKDHVLPRELVLSLIRNPSYNVGGKFDYGAFCAEVFETSSQLVKAAKEKAWQMEEKAAVNSGTYKVS